MTRHALFWGAKKHQGGVSELLKCLELRHLATVSVTRLMITFLHQQQPLSQLYVPVTLPSSLLCALTARRVTAENVEQKTHLFDALKSIWK